ncbi:MAG: Class SAM-dependent methyltransferase [Candidatus Poribacteria bacterium]|nr:Class SAM-dependent methyltransferase [Candidatus Poribacteria bacterium]
MKKKLPDFYKTVAEEVLCRCHPKEGVWLDLGSGAGGVGLSLAEQTTSMIVMIDPNQDALQKALSEAKRAELGKRVIAIKAMAEDIPLPDNCIDLVVSRGSIFFWNDRAQGLREVFRILCPGGVAMVGGGLGASYPQWARQEFTRRRHEEMKKEGPEAYKRFQEARSSQTFQQLAHDAGLLDFEVVSDGEPDSESSQAGLGIWILLRKGNGKIKIDNLI